MRYLLSLIVLVSFITDCATDPDDSNLSRADAFQSRWIVIGTDVDRAYSDRTITIATRCKPLLKGKGRIAIWGTAYWREDSRWIVEWPVQDTLVGEVVESFPVEIPVSFDPVAEFAQQWQVRLYPQESHGNNDFYFQAHAMMDSVFLADSNRYFSTESLEVRRHSRDGRGYEPGAISTILRLEKP